MDHRYVHLRGDPSHDLATLRELYNVLNFGVQNNKTNWSHRTGNNIKEKCQEAKKRRPIRRVPA